ncbi:MAG: YdeI/OmpD-associated family protein [Pseudonocardiales bacterium]
MKFHATVDANGKTATGIRVPDDVMTALGPSKRPKIRVTINGHTYRTSVASMGGSFVFGVSADVRSRAAVAAGDAVDVEVELDTEPREITVPADLGAALEDDTAAQRFFDGLSYSHQRRYVEWVESAKKAETRQRRVDQAVLRLREGRVQG